MNIKFIQNSSCFLRFKCFIKRRTCMCLRLSITNVIRSASWYRLSTKSRICKAQSMAVRLWVTITSRLPAKSSKNINYWLHCVHIQCRNVLLFPVLLGSRFDLLFTSFIHADKGIFWVVRFLIDFKYIFHSTNLHWLQVVCTIPRFDFFEILRTVSSEMLST